MTFPLPAYQTSVEARLVYHTSKPMHPAPHESYGSTSTNQPPNSPQTWCHVLPMLSHTSLYRAYTAIISREKHVSRFIRPRSLASLIAPSNPLNSHFLIIYLRCPNCIAGHGLYAILIAPTFTPLKYYTFGGSLFSNATAPKKLWRRHRRIHSLEESWKAPLRPAQVIETPGYGQSHNTQAVSNHKSLLCKGTIISPASTRSYASRSLP